MLSQNNKHHFTHHKILVPYFAESDEIRIIIVFSTVSLDHHDSLILNYPFSPHINFWMRKLLTHFEVPAMAYVNMDVLNIIHLFNLQVTTYLSM